MENLRIRQLSDDIIRKFISGNIINDISHILKELLENSCDASSSKIFIYIENSGRDLISIFDNGIGIYKDDLIKLCQRYSTSKVFSVNDLHNIKTYGFKGEALFAISIIANLEIISKPLPQNVAWKINFDKLSRLYCLEPNIGGDGTKISIKNLDLNSLNYSDLEESKNIFNKLYFVFKCIALSNFNIHFIFYNDGKEYINLPACLDHVSKIKRIEYLLGSDFLNESIDVSFEENNIKINGFITTNTTKCKISDFKFLFINNRFVDDKFINISIQKIFDSFVKKKVIFSYCLYLFLDSDLFFFNLNSKKIEIKFKEEKLLYNFLFKCLSKTFLKNKMIFFLENDNSDNISNKVETINDELNYFTINKLLSNDMYYLSHNKFLTVLNNKVLFFELDNKVFFVSLIKLRCRIIIKSCIDEFLTVGKLYSEKIFFHKFFDLEKKQSLLLYKNFFALYGFYFENFRNEAILIYGVPKILYNLLVNWQKLFLDLIDFLDRSIVSHFSINRLDMDIINIFLKHIHKKSPIYKFEIDHIYNELLFISKNDKEWFLKNCFEVTCNKAERFD